MKKISLVMMAFSAFVLFSCNSNEAPAEEVVVDEVEEIIEDVEVEASSGEVPNFENAELTEFTKEFSVFFDKSMVLLKAGDMEGLSAMDDEGKALQAKGETLKNNVSEADKALLEEYLKGKAGEMLSASGLDQLGEKMKEEMNNTEK